MVPIATATTTATVIFTQKEPTEVFYKKTVLKSFAIFTRKHLC